MYNTRPDEAREALWNEPCLAATVRRVHRVVARTYDDALRPHGLTAAQLDVLMTVLTSQRPLRRIELARALQAERSTITRNLRRLQDQGFISTGDTSRGDAHLKVTPAGRRAAERAAGAWFRAQRDMRVRLGDDGVAALETLNRSLADEKGE